MASEIRANTLKNRVGLGTVSYTDTGIIVSGIVTANSFKGDGSSLTGIDATSLKDSAGNVKIQAQASGAVFTGIHTFSSAIDIGSNIKIGNAGVVTSTTFVGNVTGNVTGNISGGTVAGSTGAFSGDVSITDKIFHTDDTNTAIRFPSNDTFTVETGGNERLRITSTGSVGVGTNNPDVGNTAYPVVQVHGTSTNAYFKLTNTTTGVGSGDGVELSLSGSDAYLTNRESANIIFRTGGSNERLRIASDGQATFDKGAPGSSNQVISRFQAESSRRLDIVWHDSGSLMGFDTPSSHSYIFKIGGSEKLRLDSDGDLKHLTSTPSAFTSTAPSQNRYFGKKCMQGSVTSTATLTGSGTGVFDLGRLWITDDSVTEIFLQIMRNDAALYNSHYCKAFIQKVRGSGMTQGHILYQNGAHSGFSVSSIQAGGYTGSGGSSHGTEIHVTGGHGGVIYRMTCFYTTISKNDMW